MKFHGRSNTTEERFVWTHNLEGYDPSRQGMHEGKQALTAVKACTREAACSCVSTSGNKTGQVLAGGKP